MFEVRSGSLSLLLLTFEYLFSGGGCEARASRGYTACGETSELFVASYLNLHSFQDDTKDDFAMVAEDADDEVCVQAVHLELLVIVPCFQRDDLDDLGAEWDSQALLHPAVEVSLLFSYLLLTLDQITPMLEAPGELGVVATPTVGKEKALLALVSPTRLARLGARMGGAPQSQSDPEEEGLEAPDISGSDTGSDPEYVPPTRQRSSSPDSDSGSDEVCTHPVCYLS